MSFVAENGRAKDNSFCLEKWHQISHRFPIEFLIVGSTDEKQRVCLRALCHALMPNTSASGGSELLAPVLGRQREEFEVSLPVPDERGRNQTMKLQ